LIPSPTAPGWFACAVTVSCEGFAMNDRDSKPRNLVVVLLDSLNRHMLGSYGGGEFDTPNLDRFARRALRFERHVTGSLPCMPARHDILCGALDFLWKPWGSIELWEDPITFHLRRAGVTSLLVSDHPHLFETGGENYHSDFSAWDYVRGHESDPWKTHPDPSWIGAPSLPARTAGANLGRPELRRRYDDSRTWFREEADYPGPRTMQAAARWLQESARHHERFFLFVDEFDPHEPFDTPAPWVDRYDEAWQGERIIWPPYAIDGVAGGVLSEREGRHLRCNYGSKLSMIDHWFGRVLDALDAADLWDETAVIVCTDHGHYLGERDLWGKPGVIQYEPLGHTPLLVAWPGVAGGASCDALTTNVDLFATAADVFDVEPEHRTHGHSLVPLLTGEREAIRDWALGGVYGNWVQVTDGRRKYARAPVGDNFPLSMWSNRWSTMPVELVPGLRLPRPDERAVLDFMPGSRVPVLRQPFAPGDLLPFWASRPKPDAHELYDLALDPEEQENRTGERIEQELVDLLRVALEAVEAPGEQLERLGLS
jgi:arylsulfatase A-like enzyme